jgi:hypothetical protein
VVSEVSLGICLDHMPCSVAGLFAGNSLLFVAIMHLLMGLLDTLIDSSYWQQNGALLESFVYIV